jgi:UDP-glucose 4-epimerase
LDLTGSSLKPEHREARAVANVQRRRAAIEKAEKMLGFKASITVEQGLSELIRWRQEAKKMPSPVVEA